MTTEIIAGKETIVVPGQGETSFRITAVPPNNQWPLNSEPGIRIVAVVVVNGRRQVRQGPTIPLSCLSSFEEAYEAIKKLISK